MVDGHKITAVGEVPLATVQFIATQVKAQDLVPAGVAAAADEPRGAPHARAAARLRVVRRDAARSSTVLGARVALPPIEVVDVDADPQLRRRHGLEVPVLLLDGTVVCRQRLDRAELTRLLRASAAAAPASRPRRRGRQFPIIRPAA